MSKKSYYVTGNTAQGFINHLSSNLKGVQQVFVLKHNSNKIKTMILNDLIKRLEEKNDIEIILSALGEKYLDGLIIRDQSVAFISDSIIPSELQQVIGINLADVISESRISEEREQAEAVFKGHLQQAYQYFEKGLQIHDELEGIFINEMDFAQADRLADEFIEKKLANVSYKEKSSIIYKRFFGTNTPEGAVNIVPEILASLDHAYFIKGRAGTGKSTFMKKVLAACTERGLDVELYQCSFDPESIDMVLIDELSFCIFDSTNPHEFFPSKQDHHVIDMYEKTVTPGTDEKYAKEIKDVTDRYKMCMKKGLEQLKKADIFLEKMEKGYEITTNERKRLVDSILRTIQ